MTDRTPPAAPKVTTAPLTAEQPARHPVGRPDASHALLRDAERYLGALHGSVARHDNLAANFGCAGCGLRDKIRAHLAAAAVAGSPR